MSIVNVDENRREDADALAAFVPNVIVTHPLGPRRQSRPVPADGRNLRKQRGDDAVCAASSSAPWKPACRGARISRSGASSTSSGASPWMTVSRDTYVSRTLALVNFLTACDDPRTDAIRSWRSPRSCSTAWTSCCYRASRFPSGNATSRRSAHSRALDVRPFGCSTARWRRGTARERFVQWTISPDSPRVHERVGIRGARSACVSRRAPGCASLSGKGSARARATVHRSIRGLRAKWASWCSGAPRRYPHAGSATTTKWSCARMHGRLRTGRRRFGPANRRGHHEGRASQ